jgi:hypothetical protein
MKLFLFGVLYILAFLITELTCNLDCSIEVGFDPYSAWSGVKYSCATNSTHVICLLDFKDKCLSNMGISLPLSRISSPFIIQREISSALCTKNLILCSLLSVNQIQEIFSKAFLRLKLESNQQNSYSLNRFNRYQVRLNVMHQRISYYNSSLYVFESFPPTSIYYEKSFKISILMDVMKCDLRNCVDMDTLHQFIKKTVDDIIQCSEVFQLEIIVRSLNGICARNFGYGLDLPTDVSIKCLTDDAAATNMDDPRQYFLPFVDPSADFIFIVNQNNYHPESSLFLDGMNHILFNGFSSSFFALLSSPNNKHLAGSGDLLVFHRKFLDVCSFHFPFSRPLNNLLAQELYETVYSSYFARGTEQSSTTNEKSIYPQQFDSLLDEELEDFIDELQLMTRNLLEYFFDNGLISVYSAEDISFTERNQLFLQYSIVSSGCNALSEVNVVNLETFERSQLPVLFRLLDMIDIHGYNSSEAYRKTQFKRISYRSIYSHVVKPKVAVITALFGGYEESCKNYVKQTEATDFYCFTDNEDIGSRGWIVDTVPYHLFQLKEEFQENAIEEINSFHNNQHPFNVAKFYKQNFHLIPVLQDYESIIWIDGTVSIQNENMTRIVRELFAERQENILVFEHHRAANLSEEVRFSIISKKYMVPSWRGFSQPVQDLDHQYQDYLSEGYTAKYWELVKQQLNWTNRNEYGVFCTCFVAFRMKDKSGQEISSVKEFLNLWHDHNRHYSTQDQISFPFVIQKLKENPFPLPNIHVYGSYELNSLFIKLPHGE